MSIIEDLCCLSVRIYCNDGESENGGSGTIIFDGSQYYVMTAAHCIMYKKTTELFKPENITLTSYAYNSLTTIRVLEIDCRSKIEDDVDYALLKIEKPNINFDYLNRIKRCDEIVDNDSFFFYGYGGPHVDNYGRKFNIKHNGQNRWHLVDENISNQSLTAMRLMEGNSGAGVFFRRMGVYYCIGYVKRLLDEDGSFNDIIVFPISLFDDMLPAETKESNLFEVVKEWNKRNDLLLEQEEMDSFRENNVQYMQNLERKMAILYPHIEEAKEKVGKQLENYLTGLKLVNRLRKSPHIYNILKENEAKEFSDLADDRSSYFCNSSYALNDFKNVKEKIRGAVLQTLENNGDVKQLVNCYTNYDLAERLLIYPLAELI